MHDHENQREDEQPEIVAHNTRLGLGLFAVYLVLYVGFMVLSTYWPQVMATRPFAGVNLAIIYGFALIVIALVLAVVYLVNCRHTPAKGD